MTDEATQQIPHLQPGNRQKPPVGWYGVPGDPATQRWFDGEDWSEFRQAAPVMVAQVPAAQPASPVRYTASSPLETVPDSHKSWNGSAWYIWDGSGWLPHRPALVVNRGAIYTFLAAAALVIVGSALPWATAPGWGTLVKGLDADGAITFVIGSVMALLGGAVLMSYASRAVLKLAVFATVAAGGTAIWDMSSMKPVTVDTGEVITPHLGAGLPLVLAGGLVGLLALAAIYSRDQRQVLSTASLVQPSGGNWPPPQQ